MPFTSVVAVVAGIGCWQQIVAELLAFGVACNEFALLPGAGALGVGHLVADSHRIYRNGCHLGVVDHS
jgi:hypothetical protein